MKIIQLPRRSSKADSQRQTEAAVNCDGETGLKKTHVFAVINQKGGVGKSSSCFHLSGAYAAMGLRVLVIDADPQASVTQGFFGSESVEAMSTEQTIAALFDEECAFVDHSTLVHATEFDRIHVCPSNQELAKFNHPTPEESGMQQYALVEFIESQVDYDVVLIDCPPNLYECTWASLVAADWVIIPVNPEDFGTQGLRAVHQAVENARVLNPKIRRLGHLVTRSDSRLLIHKFYETRLRKKYGNLVLNNFLSELSAFKVAVANRTPVQFHEPNGRAARLTRKLSREILDRIDVNNAKRKAA